MKQRSLLPILVIGSLVLLLGAACVDVAPPPSRIVLTPTITPTNVPTATPVPVTPTLTSTTTPTPTTVPTGTPAALPSATQPSIVYDPRTGLSTVPQFSPPIGAGGLPTTGSVPSSILPPAGTGAGGGQSTAWGCDGDEIVQFDPFSPVVGQKVFIYVTAARDRQFVLLYGPQTTGVVDKPIAGGIGLRRAWEVVPTSPGVYTYEFYAGPSPSDLCKSLI